MTNNISTACKTYGRKKRKRSYWVGDDDPALQPGKEVERRPPLYACPLLNSYSPELPTILTIIYHSCATVLEFYAFCCFLLSNEYPETHSCFFKPLSVFPNQLINCKSRAPELNTRITGVPQLPQELFEYNFYPVSIYIHLSGNQFTPVHSAPYVSTSGDVVY